MSLFSFFPSFIFLFNLFCLSSLCQRVVLLNLLDIKVNSKCSLFSERESRRSPIMRDVVGGAMVLGKFSVPGSPTNLNNSRPRANLRLQ